MEKRLTEDLNVVANSNLEIQLLDGDLNIIQKLDDEPNDVGGLTSAELKAKFDESGNIIKKYINETLIPAVLTEDATEEDRKQAEAARVAAEQGRVTAEEGRVSAETAREQAETARTSAETARGNAESQRSSAETTRVDNETARNQGETTRVAAENVRANAETGRSQAEQNRAQSETARDQAETARQNSENYRDTREAERVQDERNRDGAEKSRASAEGIRRRNETARESAESTRQANETARQNAENARQTAETSRTQAETARNVWEDYDSTKGYQPGNKVYWQGSSYVCLKACSGISPENGTYWQLVVRSGFASDSAFGFDVVNGRLLCYYSGDNPPPFRLGDDGHLYVDLDKTYDLGKVTGGSGSGGGVDIDLGMTGAAAGQVAKVKAVDTDGKPTAWEPADLPGGGSGETWEKIAETTLTEIVNEIRLNFDPCKAVYLEFQYGAVENDLGAIGIYPNPKTPIYTGEKRACAIDTTTSAANKRGYIFCTIDRRKGTQWVATSQTFFRGDGTFGSIKPGEAMNCDIDIFNNNTWASVLWKPRLAGTDYINSVSAFGAGMAIGTTLTVWGIKV